MTTSFYQAEYEILFECLFHLKKKKKKKNEKYIAARGEEVSRRRFEMWRSRVRFVASAKTPGVVVSIAASSGRWSVTGSRVTLGSSWPWRGSCRDQMGFVHTTTFSPRAPAPAPATLAQLAEKARAVFLQAPETLHSPKLTFQNGSPSKYLYRYAPKRLDII